MALKTKSWDASEHLDSEEMIFAYINAAFEEGNPALVTAALGDVARARGMTQIAKMAGVSRESLYKALSADGNPEFATIMKVMQALKLHLSVSKADDTEDCENHSEVRLSA
ncbi:putative addiction module antidote protein [Mesorhizobium sp. M7A.F.Ca.US.011.01.1.1]|uniref:addiction module antidote protein n=1 Tax=Mesorhizobium sp. M7A.F.Ca.US.011.01.1.1 TaxID=2496741 RepID=UPI000FCBC9F1|nr:addiction module antidote protein [Mesorhizobium sp. M7A.F.Ca.US.011.01.1.1]RUX23784.1 putative addiction module antidote protein [Mesorhizobium sp. M7A.F.Ca.US.011.01.1.1]